MQRSGEDTAAEAIEKLGNAGVRALGLRVLRELHARHPERTRIDLGADFAVPFFDQALSETGVRLAPDACAELLHGCVERPPLHPLLEFLWWLVRAGYVIPVLGPQAVPHALAITTVGARFLTLGVGDQPLLPGFLERLRLRCPGIPEQTLLHLEDAKACVEHALHRPALVLIGAAYEAAIDNLGEHLLQTGKLKKAFEVAKGWERVNMLKHALPNLGLTADERSQAARALDFAHKLRERRADTFTRAPTYPFDEAAELEELLVSAGRQLPSLWILRGVA